jgi:hypothetical protein
MCPLSKDAFADIANAEIDAFTWKSDMQVRIYTFKLWL